MLKSWRLILGALWVVLAMVSQGTAQTAATGAIAGTVTDASGAIVVGAHVKVTNEATGEVRQLTSRSDGGYIAPLLPPGRYRVEISQMGFKTFSVSSLHVQVSETATANAHLQVGGTDQSVEVRGNAAELQTQSAQLGRVTTGEMISTLPLVTRNYTQIIALNPGISSEPNDAGALGRGNGSYGAGGGGFSANGGTTNDNNFQMNGVEINDTMGSQVNSGGIAVPNPDSLQEFKVLTGQYDASYGRNAGANVNVVGKSGTNQFHGLLFEYLRNDALNANTWNRNLSGQKRPVLKQNQFGGTIGGPILKDKLFYFGSYQGTRQRNGLDSNCASTVYTPPLTNDRSPAGLGAVFAGQRGYVQDLLGGVGPAVAADGSNISPVALAILQAKLPDGSYLIPTPQRLNPSNGFDAEGVTDYSIACPYTENQFMTNVDFQQNDKSRWAGRFFWSNSVATDTLRSSSVFGGGGVPGFPLNSVANFRNFSLDNTYVFTPTLLNQATIGYTRQHAGGVQTNPYTFSDFGITAPDVDNPPVIGIGLATGGLSLGGYGQGVVFNQNTYVAQDQLVWVKGRHTLKFGGGVSRIQINEPGIKYSGLLGYYTYADLLLGLDANGNGTAGIFPVSNVFATVEFLGDKKAYYRVLDANSYLQDDIKLTQHFTLNLGLRYERLGDMSQPDGLMTSLDTALLNPTPPAAGTYAGYTVPANYKGPLPDGITRQDNNYGVRGIGQNTWNPRVGFAWQLPGSDRVVLRGGYGLFHMRTTGQGLIQSVSAPPWAYLRYQIDDVAQNSTNANPFPAGLPTLPYFPPITPDAGLSFEVLAQNFRPPTYQHYSLGVQSQLTRSLILDVSYVGGRGTQLLEQKYVNQAMLASPENPIRTVTTNTPNNVNSRVPYQGFPANGLEVIQNGAASWYNALDVSATKSLSYGLQFLASYTWARDLTDAPGIVSNSIGGGLTGDQNDPKQRYGPDTFIREHRFVLSYIYSLPGPKNLNSWLGETLGGWQWSGVTTIQSGHRLYATYNNQLNVYGTGRFDRPDLVQGCNLSASPGFSIERSISDPNYTGTYFNTACFTTPAPLGGGTGFGNSPVGIITGPRDVNFDMSLAKKFMVNFPREGANLEFRTDFFNAFNHPQFADPVTAFNTGLFGKFTGDTITNPRIIQFALRYSF